MAKSCINILQEYSVSKGHGLPEYKEKNVSPNVGQPLFEFSVSFNGSTWTDRAQNKKQAKEGCARKAVQAVGLDQLFTRPLTHTTSASPHAQPLYPPSPNTIHLNPKDTDTTDGSASPRAAIPHPLILPTQFHNNTVHLNVSSHVSNYTTDASASLRAQAPVALVQANYNAIGLLNEYTSQRGMAYPEYTFVGSNEKGDMIVSVRMGELLAHGLGRNKKLAKQIAAINLYEKIQGPVQLPKTSPQKTNVLAYTPSDCVDSTTIDELLSLSHIDDMPKSPQKPEEEVICNIPPLDIPSEKTAECESDIPSEETAECESKLFEGFKSKLEKFDLDDEKLIISKQSKGYVLQYINDEKSLQIVKICYTLADGLNEVYEAIKKQME